MQDGKVDNLDNNGLTNAWLKYAVSKVFQHDGHQNCLSETFHQG